MTAEECYLEILSTFFTPQLFQHGPKDEILILQQDEATRLIAHI